MTDAEIIDRWAHCRCRFARAPMDPCVCTPATLALASRESRMTTKRWETWLSPKSPVVVRTGIGPERLPGCDGTVKIRYTVGRS
jgi:hypothetical protein